MSRYILPLVGALMLTACSADPNPASSPDADLPMPTDDAVAEPDSRTAAIPTPQEFADTVAASDMYEVEAAKLAQKSGSSKATKEFAAMMIKDHTASTEELKTASGKAQPPIVLTPKLSFEQQTELDALNAAGQDFDGRYAEQQVAAHDKALGLLEAYSQSGGDPSLKSFASDTLKIVRNHADRARQLRGK